MIILFCSVRTGEGERQQTFKSKVVYLIIIVIIMLRGRATPYHLFYSMCCCLCMIAAYRSIEVYQRRPSQFHLAASNAAPTMATTDKINRTGSFRSIDRRSADRSSNHGTSENRVEGAERFFQQMKRGASRGPGATELDAASETSSQQERKFAALLGPDPHDLFAGGRAGSSGPMNVGKRLYITGVTRLQEKEERLQDVRERILMREMAEMTQRPAITRKARQRQKKGKLFADQGAEWIEKKVSNLAVLKQKMRDAEVEGMQPQPTLNRKSSIIVERLDTEYKSPVSGWESHFAKFCSRNTSAATPRETFQPSINSNAVRVDIEKDIGERLYEDSIARDEKKKAAEKEQRERELTDPNTGRALFSPQPLDVGREKRSPIKITEDLLEEGKRLEKKKEALKETILKSDPNLTFSPSLNKRSIAIADSSNTKRKPLHEPVQRKIDLDDSKAKASPDTAVAASPAVGTVATINKKKNFSDPNDFLRRIELSVHLRHQRLAELQNTLLEEERRLCSFQPLLNRKSVELVEQLETYSSEDLSAVRLMLQQQQPNLSHQSTAETLLKPRFNSDSVGRQSTTPRRAHVAHASSLLASSPSPVALDVGRAVSLATGASSLGAAPSSPRPPKVSEYVSSFEQQMFAVLDEWRKVEDGAL